MSDPFIGEIKMFAGNFAPRGYALCDGQLLAISQNDALFSLLGTTYGGDGRTTFALPDMRGRLPIHADSSFTLGQKSGSETVSMTVSQMPQHEHGIAATTDFASDNDPSGGLPATAAGENLYNATADADSAMRAGTISDRGSNQPMTNLMPYQCVNFIIALVGIYPSRT
jgi:microcystin-dependent protein